MPSARGEGSHPLRERLARIQDANPFLRPEAGPSRSLSDPQASGFPPELLSIVHDALGDLRRLLEDPREARVTWQHPLVELRYPVELQWGPDLPATPRRNRPTGVSSTSGGAAESRPSTRLPYTGLEFLASLTRRSIVVREQGQQLLQAPDDSPEEVRPFTFGMVERSALPPGLVADREAPLAAGHLIPLTSEISGQLAFAIESFAPGLDFRGHRASGDPFAGSIVGQVRPLVLDLDLRQAYYPVTVGIFLHPPPDAPPGSVPPAAPDPSEWSSGDLRSFWEAVFQAASGSQDPDQPSITSEAPGSMQGSPQTGALLRRLPLPPPLEVRPPTLPFEVAFGPVRVDNTSLAYVSNLHNLRFPKRLRDIPDLEAMKTIEAERIFASLGEEAFRDLRSESGSKAARGPWLRRRPAVGGGFQLQLTSEAERNLKIREGLDGSGYRFVAKTWRREFLTRVFQVGRKGYVEVGLSWFGIAGLWTDEGKRALQQKAADLAESLSQPLLFEDLNERQRRLVESTVRQAEIFLDGQKLMRALLVQVPKQGTTVVELSAFAVRKLLGIQNDPRWRDRALGAIYALTECKFLIDSFQTPQKFQAYGQFLAGHDYLGAGPGKHADGVFRFYVDPRFLGCLNAYAKDKPRLDSGKEILEFDFGQKPPLEDLQAMSYSFTDAGLPWYHAEEKFTPQQENLVTWVYQQRTLEGDARSRRLRSGQGARRIPTGDSPESRRPRVYGPEFCPLLPPDRPFHGALGRFRSGHNPEAGWTLRSLLPKLGYPPFPRGMAHSTRKRLLRQALQDFHLVLVEYLEGCVAARLDDQWHSLAAIQDALEQGTLSARRVYQETTWFPFVPDDCEQIQIRKWERRLAAQAMAGEDRFAYTYTSDPQEAALSRVARIEGTTPLVEGKAPTPLGERLAETRKERGISQEDLGRRFGVTKMSVSRWETGKKPVRKALVPLIERWLQDPGSWPTKSELAKTSDPAS